MYLWAYRWGLVRFDGTVWVGGFDTAAQVERMIATRLEIRAV